MNHDNYKWNSVTYYVDESTGEQIHKSEIGSNYLKGPLLDTQIRYDSETFTKTLIRTVSVSKIPVKQLTLF